MRKEHWKKIERQTQRTMKKIIKGKRKAKRDEKAYRIKTCFLMLVKSGKSDRV